MKTILLLILFIHIVQSVFAQDKVRKPVSAKASNLFLELGANGGIFSINYDTRFAKSEKGIGGRIGIGIIPSVDIVIAKTSSILTIPIALNYLAGKAPNYWEFGAGSTIVSGNTKASGVAFVPSIGYRYQPAHKGFTGRVVFSPFIGQGGILLRGGFSLGIRL